MDTHKLIAALDDGTYVLVRTFDTWAEAINVWTDLDDMRREGKYQSVKYLAVRRADDPDPRWATAKRGALLRTPGPKFDRLWTSKHGDAERNLGRAIGRAVGYTGRGGGWVDDERGRIIVQGWASLAHIFYGAHYVIAEKGYRLSPEGLDKLARQIAKRTAVAA